MQFIANSEAGPLIIEAFRLGYVGAWTRRKVRMGCLSLFSTEAEFWLVTVLTRQDLLDLIGIRCGYSEAFATLLEPLAETAKLVINRHLPPDGLLVVCRFEGLLVGIWTHIRHHDVVFRFEVYLDCNLVKPH